MDFYSGVVVGLVLGLGICLFMALIINTKH